jgi:hypothetical protein
MALSIACILASLHEESPKSKNGAGSPTQDVSTLQKQAM